MERSMPDRTLLYSGQMGGKSTFIGGLYSHLSTQNGKKVSYRVQTEPEDFEKQLISPLLEQHQYPHQNPDPYLIDFIVKEESHTQPSTEVTVLDVPGEVVELSRHEPPWKDQRDEETIERRYAELDVDEDYRDYVPPAEWGTVLTHEYNRSDNLIFLLNLYKLFMTNQPTLAYHADDLREAAKEKDVAVVAIGTDILNHEPREDIVGRSGILDYIRKSGAPVDSALLEELDGTTPPRVTNILSTIKMNDSISFFGVAVPSRESGEDVRPVVTEDGGIETWGFGNAIRWMK
jgi:hypothetical protein